LKNIFIHFIIEKLLGKKRTPTSNECVVGVQTA